MYGMVNKAVRGLVIENFSEETWQKIRSIADAPDNFVAFEQYDDAVTYNLVGAAVEVLNMPAEDVLKAFGDYWIRRVATVSYAELMDKTGNNFVGFVQNLDHLHSRIKATFPGYTPPSFRVKHIDDHHFWLDYYSNREGLLPFVEGLMTSLAHHFDTEIEIEHLADDAHAMPCKRMKVSHRPTNGE